MNDQRLLGLTATQLNLAFVAVIALLAVGGVFATGGPSKVLDEGKTALGLDSSPSFTASQDSTATPQVTAPPCAQLAVGCKALVGNTGGAGLNIRSGPGLGAETVGVYHAGDVVILAEGPVLADGYTWWRTDQCQSSCGWVADGDGTTAWLAPTPGNGLGEPPKVATAACPIPSSGDSEMVISSVGDEYGSTMGGIDITRYWWLPTVTEQGTPVCLQQPLAKLGWYIGPEVRFSCEASEPYVDGLIYVDEQRKPVRITQTVRCERYHCQDYPATPTDSNGRTFEPYYGMGVGDDNIVRCRDPRFIPQPLYDDFTPRQ